MNKAIAPRHSECGAGFYAIGRDGLVRCGLCGEVADVVTGHATIISAVVLDAAAARRLVLRVVK